MPDLWMEFTSFMKVDADSDGALVHWNRNRALSRTQMSDYLVSSGHIDLAANAANTTVSMGDVGTGHFLYLESNVDLFTFNLGSATEIPLSQRISSQPAIVQMMTEFTAIKVTAGTNAGRLTYLIAGVE